MTFPWFIGIRYLKPRGRFVSTITLISIMGVALGVTVLLVVIAVVSGYEKKIKEEFLKAEPALVIGPPQDDSFGAEAQPPDWEPVAEMVRKQPLVTSVSPVVSVTCVIENPAPSDQEDQPSSEAQAFLVGIDTTDNQQKARLRNLMSEKGKGSGNFQLEDNGIVVTKATENLLRQNHNGNFLLGTQQVNIFGPSFLNEYRNYQEKKSSSTRPAAENSSSPSPLASGDIPDVSKEPTLPVPPTFVVQGIIDDEKISEQASGFISLENAQKLNGTLEKINFLTVELTDPFKAGEVKKALKDQGLPPGWVVQTWAERHQNFFDVIASQRALMYLILVFISIVAAFCIMNTMITMAVQKRRDIGMMRALGAKTSQIVYIFVAKGLMVAGLGVGSGYLLGKIILHYRNHLRSWIENTFNWQIFDERIYGLREIPADPRVLDNIMICGIAFVLCTLAAVPPALLVGRLDPARALRTDR